MKLSREQALRIINKIMSDRLVTTVAFELGIIDSFFVYSGQEIARQNGKAVPILTVNDVIEALTINEEGSKW